MKKLITLLLAAGLICSFNSQAQAVEVKASGIFDMVFEGFNGLNGSNSFMDSKDYFNNYGQNRPDRYNKHFDAVQRIRLDMDFIISETLSAHYGLQVGTFSWGGPSYGVFPNENSGGALGTRATNISTRLAYIDWVIPQTDTMIRMGQQYYTLPSYAITSPVLDDTATGLTAHVPFNDDVALTAYWIRALSSARRGDTSGIAPFARDDRDSYDLFGLNLDLQFDGWQLTPWGIYGLLGRDAYGVRGGDSVAMGALPINGYDRLTWQNGVLTGRSDPSGSQVWFAGIGGEVTLWDPLRLAADFYYSSSSNDHSSTERSGWYIAASAEYHTANGVPTVKGWYATGDDSNPANGSERPLTLSGGFDPGATMYFQGRYSIANTIDRGDAGGTWGVSVQWNDFSFVENLLHSLRVTYFQGTNNSKMPGLINWGYANDWRVTPANYLTTKDHVVEIDFDTTYYIYKNLATVLELGYAIQDFDDNVWRGVNNTEAKFSDAWRAALNFRYTF